MLGNPRKRKLGEISDQLNRLITPNEAAEQTKETEKKLDEVDSNLDKFEDKLNTKLSDVNAKLEKAEELQKELKGE